MPAPRAEPFIPIAELVPEDLFASLVTESQEVFTDYARVHVVAVRFDLCDRIAPGPCAADADGRLRLVLQPLNETFGAEDVALHAFYPIPNGELPAMIDALRALATMADVPADAPLAVSPALTADPTGAYRDALRRLVLSYAAPTKLTRLTLFAQFSQSAALHWLFRGVERDGDGFTRLRVPDIDDDQQEALLVGRLFGYFGEEPVISQRVVNESEQVLAEIAARPIP